MYRSKPSRLAGAPALLAVLLLLMTVVMGGVWHSHGNTSGDACQICHVSHQPVAQHLVVDRVSAPIIFATVPLPADATGVPGPSIILAVPRAPPAA
ncbi:MAG: hypothetical protein WAM91_02520 [Candidatus Acidiferrales bacterium]